jgi:hypothetical protein
MPKFLTKLINRPYFVAHGTKQNIIFTSYKVTSYPIYFQISQKYLDIIILFGANEVKSSELVSLKISSFLGRAMLETYTRLISFSAWSQIELKDELNSSCSQVSIFSCSPTTGGARTEVRLGLALVLVVSGIWSKILFVISFTYWAICTTIDDYQ